MRGLLILALTALPASAQQAGWGNVGKAEESTGFDWTRPLFDGFWMAWTPATLALFLGIFTAIFVIGALEVWRFGDGLARRGILGLDTTLGDRLFLSLLGTAFVFLAWLGLVGQPVWGALGLSVVWAGFVFWKV